MIHYLKAIVESEEYRGEGFICIITPCTQGEPLGREFLGNVKMTFPDDDFTTVEEHVTCEECKEELK